VQGEALADSAQADEEDEGDNGEWLDDPEFIDWSDGGEKPPGRAKLINVDDD
jgi:hypothetical protein